jgi:REP element-mobilizing transposase RayT
MPPHHRRSIRLPAYDYSNPGAYFITLVTWNREPLLGKIIDGAMQLNDVGFLVSNEWLHLASRFSNVQLDEFVVMPNHLHAILYLTDAPIAGSAALGNILRTFKATTTRLINGLRRTPALPFWQRNYYERILRDDQELETVQVYIQSNPSNWQQDDENITEAK